MKKRKIPTQAEYDAALKDFVKNMWPEYEGVRRPYGKQPELFFESLNPKPHQHNVDVVLAIGGRRSGKTLGMSVRCWQIALENPGCTIIAGSNVFNDFRQNVLEKYWMPAFSKHEPWDSPLILKSYTEHRKEIRFTNGSMVYVPPFKEWRRIRGKEAILSVIDEASQIEDAQVFEELGRSMSGKGEFRQIILTTNPEETFGWLYDTFSLKQFEPGYDGTPMPIGPECFCQYCTECIKPQNKMQKIEWVDEKCPQCSTKKKNKCPGRQHYYRVVFMNPEDNPTLPTTYLADQMGMLDAEKFSVYSAGQIKQLRVGKVYHNYSKANLFEYDIPVDFEKNIFWCVDFNRKPQCSVICQEDVLDKFIGVLDEIVEWESGPEEVALAFAERYRGFKKTVYLVGDPAGLNLTGATNKREVTRYQYIYDILTDKELGNDFDVKILTRKIKGQTKVYLKERIDNINVLLKDYTNVVRLKINPKLSWTRASLEGTLWKNNTKNLELDQRYDNRAKEATDFSKVYPVTHPADALTYYIAKRWPLKKDTKGNPYIQIPGEVVLELTPQGVIENLYRATEQKEHDSESLLSYLEELAAFEDPEDTPLATFYGNYF